MKTLLFCVLSVTGIHAEEAKPFLTIRQTSRTPVAFLEQALDVHRRIPGACDEIWFSSVAFCCTDEKIDAGLDRIAALRSKCEAAGIRLSYQQGTTLGHGHVMVGDPQAVAASGIYATNEVRRFSEDAWMVGRDGKRMTWRRFCPSSPEVRLATSNYVRRVLAKLSPYSYWPDDDLRLGFCTDEGCFCPRCRGKRPETLLADYLSVYRQAAHAAKSPVLFGLQTVAPHAPDTVADYREMLASLAAGGHRVGIRPGHGVYTEVKPSDFVGKALGVAAEAERCRAYGDLVGPICYEEDNYPRRVLHKSPAAIVTEGALALAAGADTLSLYFSAGGEVPADDIADYERFVRFVAESRPYLERVAEVTRRTHLAGVVAPVAYACAGIPVSVTESPAAIGWPSSVACSKDAYPYVAYLDIVREALDRATDGRFPVRVDLHHPLTLLPRVDADGRLVAVSVLNGSIGETGPFDLRVRHPACERTELAAPRRVPQQLRLKKGAGESVVTMPSLGPWEIVTVFFQSEAESWRDFAESAVDGRAFAGRTAAPYDRLPAAVSNRVPKAVWDLSRDSSGMSARFTVRAKRLRLRWSLTSGRLGTDRMCPAARSGIDVYRRTVDGWRYVTTGAPTGQFGNVVEVPWTPDEECLVCFPNYNGLARLEVGTEAGGSVAPAAPHAKGGGRPVVFYGTSITQGAHASRPGMSYVNIIGRRLDVPVVNLGFSGNGVMDATTCACVAEIDAAAFVVDAGWNMTAEEISARWPDFVRQLHDRHPSAPIVLVEPTFVRPCTIADIPDRAVAVRAVYERMSREDASLASILRLVRADDQYAAEDKSDDTVDGIHPNDLGMTRIATALGRVLEPLVSVEPASDAERHASGDMNRTRTMPQLSYGTESAESVRVLVIGNSIALHGPKPAIGWTNIWGMAASAVEKDFAHLVFKGVESRLKRPVCGRVLNFSDLELHHLENDWKRPSERLPESIRAFRPDHVVIALSENVGSLAEPAAAASWRSALTELARYFVQKGAGVVLRTPFWPNAQKAELTREAAAEAGAGVAEAGDLGEVSSSYAGRVHFWHAGVAAHPGDAGMAALAERILAALFGDVPQPAVAKWIAGSVSTDAPPAFRRSFVVSGAARRAELAICGLGYSVAELNGRRIGEHELDPVPSDYSRRVYYSTYDVTDLIRPGTNDLSVLLGRGWHDFRERDEWNFDKARWKGEPKLRLRLTVETADGTHSEIVSDETWRQVGNPVRFDSVRSGIEEDGPVPSLDAPVRIVNGPTGLLMPSPCAPTKVMRRLRPVRSRDLGEGRWLFDFGEALSGRVRLTSRGLRAGDVVTVRYDERIGADFTPATNRVIDAYYKGAEKSFQTDVHHAAGTDGESFAPRFTYKGFRYALVTGLRLPPNDGDVVAEELQTAFEKTGTFDCSSAVLNGLLAMADRSYRANFANGVPTDCPHREKNGWTGDVNLACEYAQYAYDNKGGYVKWLWDLVDAQRPDGRLPGIAPTADWGYDNFGTAWDGAMAEVPETVYRFTGDRRVLSEFYPALRRNVDYRLMHQVRADGTLDEGPGDWCPIATRTTNALVSTAWFYGTLRAAARIAARLGETSDARRYNERADFLKTAFNRAFYCGDGVYAGRTQTAQALALHFDLAPDRLAAERQLRAAVKAADDHLDCGVLGSRTMFRVLSEMGRTDLAYRLIVQPTSPSFGAWFAAGDTALREDFADGFSRCHVMFADFAAWAYAYLAGIRDVEDGFACFTLAPETIAALNHVTASLKTPKGTVRSHWERKDGRVTFRFSIPVGATAMVRFGGTSAEYGAGEHELSQCEREENKGEGGYEK